MKKVREDCDFVDGWDSYDTNSRTLIVDKALRRCVVVDQTYAIYLRLALNEHLSCSDDEADPDYRTFLVNTKPHGTSYVFEAPHRNVLLKYDQEDSIEFDHHMNLTNDSKCQVEDDHENVRGKYELRSLKRRNASKLQKHEIEDEFMDEGVKTEPKEDSDCNSNEETSHSEVEILVNVGVELGKGSSSNPCQPISSPDASTVVDSGYRKEVLNVLMRPYDEKEYKRLWKSIKKPINRCGKSYLTLHKTVNQELKRDGHNKEKWLNIMRGFFFWLEHLTQPDAFQPWKDAECLRTKPG